MLELPRDFKGIWIPREIWLDRRLTYFERALFSEIHSLNGKDGCFASNEYFCAFFEEKERKIQDGLAKLKSIGYIWVESFDGRTRILRTTLTPEIKQISPEPVKSLFSTSGVSDFAPLGCEIPHPSTGADTLYREKKDNKEETTQGVGFSFSSKEKEKLKDFTPEQIEYATRVTNENCSCQKNTARVKYFFAILAAKPKNKLSTYDELKLHFKHGEVYNGATCYLSNEAITFERGMTHREMKLQYFSWDNFKVICDSFGIKFSRKKQSDNL
jgi:hypothetical protein